MGSIGASELLIILVIVLVLFGGRKMPELGRSLGLGLANFKKSVKGESDADEPSSNNTEIKS